MEGVFGADGKGAVTLAEEGDGAAAGGENLGAVEFCEHAADVLGNCGRAPSLLDEVGEGGPEGAHRHNGRHVNSIKIS